jgi:hypothetical protein
MILCPVCSHPIAIAAARLTPEADAHSQMVACGTCHSVTQIEQKLMRATDLTDEELAKRLNRTT